nr:hypothetical protein Itr_chr15CG12210 [Ipomoea trifida]
MFGCLILPRELTSLSNSFWLTVNLSLNLLTAIWLPSPNVALYTVPFPGEGAIEEGVAGHGVEPLYPHSRRLLTNALSLNA